MQQMDIVWCWLGLFLWLISQFICSHFIDQIKDRLMWKMSRLENWLLNIESTSNIWKLGPQKWTCLFIPSANSQKNFTERFKSLSINLALLSHLLLMSAAQLAQLLAQRLVVALQLLQLHRLAVGDKHGKLFIHLSTLHVVVFIFISSCRLVWIHGKWTLYQDFYIWTLWHGLKVHRLLTSIHKNSREEWFTKTISWQTVSTHYSQYD